jgi:hypothetical protein
MLQVVAWVLLLVAVVLLLNVGGAANAVIRNLTSKSLGDLAPGYAASPTGLKIYAGIIGAIGLIFAGLDEATLFPIWGLVAMIGGAIGFIGLSILAIRGEVRTYRALRR